MWYTNKWPNQMQKFVSAAIILHCINANNHNRNAHCYSYNLWFAGTQSSNGKLHCCKRLGLHYLWAVRVVHCASMRYSAPQWQEAQGGDRPPVNTASVHISSSRRRSQCIQALSSSKHVCWQPRHHPRITIIRVNSFQFTYAQKSIFKSINIWNSDFESIRLHYEEFYIIY